MSQKKDINLEPLDQQLNSKPSKEKNRLADILENSASSQLCELIGNQKSTNENMMSIDSFVVCVDIRNSTKLMTVASDPKVFVDFIAELIKKFKAQIIEHDGIFDKFTGDGVLCHFPMFEEYDEKKQKELRENIIWLFEEFNNIFMREYLFNDLTLKGE